MHRSSFAHRAARALATAGVGLALLASGGQAAAAGGTPSPGLPRGAAPDVPWISGQTLHDGARTVALTFDRDQAWEVERARVGWFVAGNRDKTWTLARVTPTGRHHVLGRGVGGWVSAPDDRRVALTQPTSADRTAVTLRRAAGGHVIASRRFTNPRVLAVHGLRVLLSAGPSAAETRVMWWDTRDGRLRTVVDGEGLRADLAADRLLLAGRNGPCGQQVVRLSDGAPIGHRLHELSVLAWSPGVRSTLMSDCYFDQPYLRRVVVRTDGGQTLSATRTSDTGERVAFSPVWESRYEWLSVRYGDGKASIVRCNRKATDCERASRTWRSRTSPYDGGLVRPHLVLGTA